MSRPRQSLCRGGCCGGGDVAACAHPEQLVQLPFKADSWPRGAVYKVTNREHFNESQNLVGQPGHLLRLCRVTLYSLCHPECCPAIGCLCNPCVVIGRVPAERVNRAPPTHFLPPAPSPQHPAPSLHFPRTSPCSMSPAGGCWLLLVYLLQGVDVSLAHNVEVSPQRSFSNGSSFFGYRVRQVNSTQGERILIGDPGSGLMHSCDVIRGSCDIISLPDQSSTRHVGLTLEVEPQSGRSIVCGSDLPRDCDQTLYMNGACYTMDAGLTPSRKLTPGYQECQKGEADLCVLIDTSSSVGSPEWESLKRFLKNTIHILKNTTVHLAIAQYSHRVRTELDFGQYQKLNNLSEVIDHIEPFRGGTRAFLGISHTLTKIFTEHAGHRPHAKKVLLMLTDGDNTDKDNGVIERADQMGVVRYLVGAGKNFQADKEESKQLASKPAANHTWVLDNYAALENMFAELQLKILAIEGSAYGSNFTRELSSSGLSAAVTRDRHLLGDPGIYDWSGGILEVSDVEKLLNVTLLEEERYGYLGYAVRALHTPEGPLYVAGAPRYQYRGLLTVFRASKDEARWLKVQNISGEQVGSYFGAEIEVGDIDGDELSDLVLVGAPHFYDMRESGRVSVYAVVQGRLQFLEKLCGEPGQPHSQFGAALSALGDLDGDGFGDVAVGAPYEADGRGALYIYRGRGGGLWPGYSQRLLGPAGSSGFGLSIHGVLDMTQDGLTDVAVGSRGGVTLHRARPLLRVRVSVSSVAPEIPVPSVESTQCEGEATLLACMEPAILTPHYTGPLNMSLRSGIILDSGRVVSRMSFENQQRNLTEVLLIQSSDVLCRNYSLLLLDCSLEDSSPVSVSLNVSQLSDDSPWLLSPSSTLSYTLEIPFQLCSGGGSCESDLHITLRTEKLVVEDGMAFSMFLKLQNEGESARRVILTATYPAGLSYRKSNITQWSRRLVLQCGESAAQRLTCNVSHPILRRHAQAEILLMFGIVHNTVWPERVQLSVGVTSDNAADPTNRTNSLSVDIPVLYPISVIARSLENSTKYLQLTNREEQRGARHIYQISNLGVSEVSAHFTIQVATPGAHSGGLHWRYCVTGKVSLGNCTSLRPPGHPNSCPHPPEAPDNKTFQCIMEKRGTIELHVTGEVTATRDWTVETSESLRTAVTIRFNESRYHSHLGSKFHNATVVTQVELAVVPDHTWYIAGGTGGGLVLLLFIMLLLYKCGFFRRYRDRMAEEPPDSALQQPLNPIGEEAMAGPQEPLTSEST